MVFNDCRHADEQRRDFADSRCVYVQHALRRLFVACKCHITHIVNTIHVISKWYKYDWLCTAAIHLRCSHLSVCSLRVALSMMIRLLLVCCIGVAVMVTGSPQFPDPPQVPGDFPMPPMPARVARSAPPPPPEGPPKRVKPITRHNPPSDQPLTSIVRWTRRSCDSYRRCHRCRRCRPGSSTRKMYVSQVGTIAFTFHIWWIIGDLFNSSILIPSSWRRRQQSCMVVCAIGVRLAAVADTCPPKRARWRIRCIALYTLYTYTLCNYRCIDLRDITYINLFQLLDGNARKNGDFLYEK